MKIASIVARLVQGTWIAALGAVFAILATFLTWASYTQGPGMGGPQTTGITGIDYANGRIVLGLAIVAVGLIGGWLGERKIAGHGLVVAVFGGLILLVLALSYFTGIFYPKSMPLLAFTDRTTVASALAQFNRILDGARAQGLNTSGSSAGLGIGFFLGIVGGVALLAGGLLGFLDDMTSPRPRRRPPTA